jgi:outer membrane protein assembly factor BamB
MTAFIITGLAGIALSSRAADWPQWRGPDRSEVSRETGLLKQWPEGGPKQVWLYRNAGIGYAGPAVAAGRLYTTGARGDREFVLAIDAQDGAELWATEIGPVLRNNWGDGPRGTPTVHDGKVYVMGGQGLLVALDAAGGKPLWKAAMTDLGGKVPSWGYTESVLIDGNRVLCTPGGPQGAVAALDAATGKLLWQSKSFTEPAQYSSLIAIEHNGVRQAIVLTMKKLAGIAIEDGALLWQSDWPGRTAVIPTPIFHDGCVFVTSGYGVGGKLVRLGPDHTVTDVYANDHLVNHHGGVLLIGDHLYGHSDKGGWTCLDFKTGEIAWQRRDALGKGAVAAADGMLYCVAESDGTVVLVEASPDGWNEKGRFKLEPQSTQRKPSGKIWTHPVIANGKLYLRDQELVYCFDVKAP